MNEQPQTTWHILGAGAIGCLWACHLTGNKRRIHLLLSPRHAKFKAGLVKLRLQTPEGLQKRVSVNANTATQLHAPINNLIVSTKATQVSHALHSISDHIAPDARIILLLNGMGFQQAVVEEYASCGVFAGVTTDGAWLRKPFDVVQAGKGVTTLGALNATASRDDVNALLEDLRNPGLLLKTSTNIEKVLLEKVMINSAINGLTAMHNCRNGELLEIAAAHAQLQQLVEELQRLLLAANEKKLAAKLPVKVKKVIKQTATNYSSTCQDIKQQRPTEIAFINGYICQLGRELGVPTPRNQEIVTAIEALER